jgi:hypothetical protein
MCRCRPRAGNPIRGNINPQTQTIKVTCFPLETPPRGEYYYAATAYGNDYVEKPALLVQLDDEDFSHAHPLGFSQAFDVVEQFC